MPRSPVGALLQVIAGLALVSGIFLPLGWTPREFVNTTSDGEVSATDRMNSDGSKGDLVRFWTTGASWVTITMDAAGEDPHHRSLPDRLVRECR